MNDPQNPELTLSISAVERDTGLSKDTLRMWERRYRFPRPLRDANGERVYPVSQVEKLRLIRRLMDRGQRPGRIIARGIDDPATLSAELQAQPSGRQELAAFLQLLKTHQLAELRRALMQTLLKQGMQRFILDTVSPLTTAVGEGWMRGDLAIFEEHLYSELLQSLLRNVLGTARPQEGGPRLLLTTLPYESHALGLLMVEAMLAIDGVECVSLGTETPLDEIARAAQAHHIDVIGVSFSAAFGDKQAGAGLTELRAHIPAHIPIWAGGSSIARLRKPILGIELAGDLERVPQLVAAWRAIRNTNDDAAS